MFNSISNVVSQFSDWFSAQCQQPPKHPITLSLPQLKLVINLKDRQAFATQFTNKIDQMIKLAPHLSIDHPFKMYLEQSKRTVRIAAESQRMFNLLEEQLISHEEFLKQREQSSEIKGYIKEVVQLHDQWNAVKLPTELNAQSVIAYKTQVEKTSYEIHMKLYELVQSDKPPFNKTFAGKDIELFLTEDAKSRLALLENCQNELEKNLGALEAFRAKYADNPTCESICIRMKATGREASELIRKIKSLNPYDSQAVTVLTKECTQKSTQIDKLVHDANEEQKNAVLAKQAKRAQEIQDLLKMEQLRAEQAQQEIENAQQEGEKAKQETQEAILETQTTQLKTEETMTEIPAAEGADIPQVPNMKASHPS